MTFSTKVASYRRVSAILTVALVTAVIVGLPNVTLAATSMSPVARLIAESDIRNQIAKFGLLVDGDDESPRDFQAMGIEEFAPEVMVLTD